MEDEKNNSAISLAGDKLKEGAKEQTKKARRKIIRKVIAILAPKLFIILIILIIALIVLEAIDSILEELKSSEAKEVLGGALEYSYISYDGSKANEERKGYKIIPTIDINSGGYKLDFSFFDENENEVPENVVLEDIKNKLKEYNIDSNKLSSTNLKIIAVLEKNGLDLEKYNEEELKSLPMFIKAEIATQNFDIRESKEEIDLESILENDLIYGTIDVTKTKVGSDGQEFSTYLHFLNYEEFKKNKEQNEISKANQYFSIDEEGNLVVAKWSKKTVGVSYKDNSGNTLSEDKIPEENRIANDGYNKVEFLPIDYKKNVNPYSLNFGLLSDLLIITQNTEFCMDLCKLAFNSQVVIDFREETTIIDETIDNTYTNTKLLCDFARYQVQGTHEVTGDTRRTSILGGTGYPEASLELRNEYGFKSNATHTTDGNTTTYTWSYNGKDYELIFIRDRKEINSTWTLYEKKTNTSEEGLPIQGNMSGKSELIKGGVDETFKAGNYTDAEQNIYTDKESNIYTVQANIHTENNCYDYNVAKVDCWFAKFERKYKEPTIEVTPSPMEPVTVEGTFENTSTETYNSEEDIARISESKAVQNYIANKISDYSSRYPDAKNVKCTIKEITQDIWEKEDVMYKSTTTTTKYKFGEEEADTTDITLKNIVYNENGPRYEKGTDVGFLSIYDEYIKNGEDLFLSQDSDKLLYEMLEDNDTTRVYSDLLKGLLYAYDGIDRGVTDLTSLLDVFKVKDFKKAGSSIMGLRQYLHQFGGSEVSTDITYDGMQFYKMYSDNTAGGLGNPTIGSGDIKYSVHHDKFNKEGYIYNKTTNTAELVNIETYISQKLGGYDALKTQAEMDNLGIYVEKEFLDSVADHIVKDYYDIVVQKTTGLDLSQQQLYALTYINYARGNINYNGGFISAYTKAIEQFEKDSWEMNKYIWDNYWCKSFSMTTISKYQGNLKGTDASFETYVNGTYKFDILPADRMPLKYYTRTQLQECGSNYNTTRTTSNEEEIFTYVKENFAEGLLGYAKMIHDYMSDPDHLYYYCLLGDSNYEYVHKNPKVGLRCGLASSFEQSTQEGQYGYRLTCCATYVSWVLEEAGLIETHYNGCEGLDNELNGWEKITDYSDLEPGDIVFMDTVGPNDGSLEHVQIYVGDGCWYNAGSNSSIQAIEPEYADASAQFVYARRQP